jgi:peptide/nickel transport system permease protein
MGGDEYSDIRTTANYEQSRLDHYQTVFDSWAVQPAKILWGDYRGRFGLLIVAFYVLVGLVGPLVVTEPQLYQADRLLGPFEQPQFPLGTTGQGQDLLGLMVYATPSMLLMILSGSIFGNFLGATVGLISGYKGGTVDKVLMTITDTVMSIPGIPLLILLAAIIQPSNPFLIGILLNIQGWAGQARSIRSQVLPLARIEYVEAARSQGKSMSGLLVKEILPQLLPLVFIRFLGGAVTIVNASVGLYFLGILPFTTQNWGIVLNQAYQDGAALYSLQAAHWLVVPLVTILILNIGLTLLAQAFDKVFNPRIRARSRGRNAESGGDETSPGGEDVLNKGGV